MGSFVRFMDIEVRFLENVSYVVANYYFHFVIGLF